MSDKIGVDNEFSAVSIGNCIIWDSYALRAEVDSHHQVVVAVHIAAYAK
jgi:hypothetical protein